MQMHGKHDNRWTGGYAESDRPMRRDEYHNDCDSYDRYSDEYNSREYAERRYSERPPWQHQQQHHSASANYDQHEARNTARIQILQPDVRSSSRHEEHCDDCDEDYEPHLQHPQSIVRSQQPDSLDQRSDRRQMDRQPTSTGPPAAASSVGGQWKSTQPNNHNGYRTKESVSSLVTNSVPKEPHLRFDNHPAPFHGHNKHDIIDGFQSTNKQPFETTDRGSSQKSVKRGEIPPAPPGPATSIKNIISNLKGVNSAYNNSRINDDRKDIPRNKVSTNPFLRKGDNPAPPFTQNHRFPRAAHQDDTVRNVQEVVQKMNSGEWPIRIEDESLHQRHRRSPEPLNFNKEKARQWETLDRGSPSMRQSEINRNDTRNIQGDRKKYAGSNDSDHYSDRSDPAENTTVSTDSAMGSDDSMNATKMTLPFELPQGTILKKMPENVRQLSDEAEKLLVYFKTHRNILNYLGIGLSETLWNHVHSLPNMFAEICLIDPNEKQKSEVSLPSIMKKVEPPQITITHPPLSPTKKPEKPPPRTKSPQKQVGRFNQSPKLNALEKELCTDTLSNTGVKINPHEHKHNNDTRGGRFVKKSAAALIAKKQGLSATLNPDEVPAPSDFADPRIAAEIQQLREREEELKRSRSELGLPSLDDVIDTWNGKGPLRLNSQNFDYLKQMDNGSQRHQNGITKSQSAHNIYIEDNVNNQKGDAYYNYNENNNREAYNDRGRRHSKGSLEENTPPRFRYQENRREREEQFFREPQNRQRPSPNSVSHMRSKCVVKGVDITVHSSARSSIPHSSSHR